MTNVRIFKGAYSYWPSYLCLACYLAFVIGFLPDVVVYHVVHFDALIIAYGFFVLHFQVRVLFGYSSKDIAPYVFWPIMGLLLVGAGLLAMVVSIFGTDAAAVLCWMFFIGLFAVAVMFQSAINNGRAVFCPWAAAACVVLAALGGWSILSAIVMFRQADRLSEGGEYWIGLPGQGVGHRGDPSWWQLRGASVLAPSDEGIDRQYLYFHAVLSTGIGKPHYHWSKRGMRFELIE